MFSSQQHTITLIIPKTEAYPGPDEKDVMIADSIGAALAGSAGRIILTGAKYVLSEEEEGKGGEYHLAGFVIASDDKHEFKGTGFKLQEGGELRGTVSVTLKNSESTEPS